MNKYYGWLMIICLMPNQLISMQKKAINSAEELKQLALHTRTETYATKLQEYDTIKPSIAADSIALLMDGTHVPIDTEGYIQNLSRDEDKYGKLVAQIMHNYDVHDEKKVSALDRVKACIYSNLDQKICQKQQELETLYPDEWAYKHMVMYESIAIGVFFLIDLIMLVPLFVNHVF
jgi:hypothetical protein